MSITIKEIERLAQLSKLTLTDEEKESFSSEISSIIEFADKLSELDVSGINPTLHVSDRYNVFREDEVSPSMKIETVLENASEADETCFLVIKAVE